MRKILVITGFLLCMALSGLQANTNKLNIKVFTPKQYKAGEYNSDITQDKRGLIYFANSSGILEFDSLNWRLIPFPNKGGAYSLVTDKEGRVYVGGEGELGYLATDSSKIYNEVIDIPEESYTKVEQAVLYVKETGIDRFAPAIGNMHGISVKPKKIRFDLIEQLRQALSPSLTFTLHGGSGTDSADLRRIVELGFNNVHISTELRLAYTTALREALIKNPQETTPYKYLGPARDAVSRIVVEKLKIYNSVNVI